MSVAEKPPAPIPIPSSKKEADVSEIIPRLWLGNVKPSENSVWLEKKGITHIVNSAGELKNRFPDKYNYFNANLQDNFTESIRDVAECAVLFIEMALIENEKNAVLVHCYMGKSRSASIVIYYLMCKYRVPYDYAYFHAKDRRKEVNPNQNYEVQLRFQV
jgi:atypical dual specificity phosphatase